MKNTTKEILKWLLILGAAILVGTISEKFGLPASHFFGGVIVGLLIAVFNITEFNIPKIAFESALAVTGVVLGAYFTPSSLTSIAQNILPIVVISFGTLVLSILMGLLLSRLTNISLATSLLGMLAGGSAMNVVTSDHIKADVRMVTLMHLIRLLLVLITTPILIHFFLAPASPLHLLTSGGVESNSPFIISFSFTMIVALLGGLLALLVPYSGSMLLTPLLLTAFLVYLPSFQGLVPPEGFREFAALIIGLQVGLRFTSSSLRTSKKYFPVVSILMLLVLAGCGLFAWILTRYTSMNALTAYLATTPGGRTAVVSLAFTAGADTTTVLAVQTLRLFMMTLIAPVVIRYLVKVRDNKRGMSLPGEDVLE